MQSDPSKRRDFSALRFSALVGRRGGVAAGSARTATADAVDPISRHRIARGAERSASEILSGCLLMSGAMALPAAAQNAPG
jgi:hypothetical protein